MSSKTIITRRGYTPGQLAWAVVQLVCGPTYPSLGYGIVPADGGMSVIDWVQPGFALDQGGHALDPYWDNVNKTLRLFYPVGAAGAPPASPAAATVDAPGGSVLSGAPGGAALSGAPGLGTIGAVPPAGATGVTSTSAQPAMTMSGAPSAGTLVVSAPTLGTLAVSAPTAPVLHPGSGVEVPVGTDDHLFSILMLLLGVY